MDTYIQQNIQLKLFCSSKQTWHLKDGFVSMGNYKSGVIILSRHFTLLLSA